MRTNETVVRLTPALSAMSFMVVIILITYVSPTVNILAKSLFVKPFFKKNRKRRTIRRTIRHFIRTISADELEKRRKDAIVTSCAPPAVGSGIPGVVTLWDGPDSGVVK